MKAIRIHAFGGPEVMKLVDVEKPVPAADEILVKMYASSVNPADYIVREGGNELLRPFLKLPLGLGLDAAGVVEHLGIFGIELVQRECNFHGVRITIEAGVSAQELESAHATHFGIGGLLEAFLETGQRFLEASHLGERLAQQAVELGQGRFELLRGVNLFDRLVVGAELEVDDGEGSMHLGDVGLEFG